MKKALIKSVSNCFLCMRPIQKNPAQFVKTLKYSTSTQPRVASCSPSITNFPCQNFEELAAKQSNVVSSWTEWDPLQEVIVGSVHGPADQKLQAHGVGVMIKSM